MFDRLQDAIRADLDRQIGWAKREALRQTRYTALTGVLAGAAGVAVLGAVVVGVIALYSWLAVQSDPLTALGMSVVACFCWGSFCWRWPSSADALGTRRDRHCKSHSQRPCSGRSHRPVTTR